MRSFLEKRSPDMETGLIIGGVLLAVAVLILFTLNRLIIIVPPNMAVKMIPLRSLEYVSATSWASILVVSKFLV